MMLSNPVDVKRPRPSHACIRPVLRTAPDRAQHETDGCSIRQNRRRASIRTRGFGTVPVEATIGSTTWRTSLLRDADNGCYLLLLKKAVRVAEGLAAGSRARLLLEPVDSLP